MKKFRKVKSLRLQLSVRGSKDSLCLFEFRIAGIISQYIKISFKNVYQLQEVSLAERAVGSTILKGEHETKTMPAWNSTRQSRKV